MALESAGDGGEDEPMTIKDFEVAEDEWVAAETQNRPRTFIGTW